MSSNIENNRHSWPMSRQAEIIDMESLNLRYYIEELENECNKLIQENESLKFQIKTIIDNINDGKIIIERKMILENQIQQEIARHNALVAEMQLSIQKFNILKDSL